MPVRCSLVVIVMHRIVHACMNAYMPREVMDGEHSLFCTTNIGLYLRISAIMGDQLADTIAGHRLRVLGGELPERDRLGTSQIRAFISSTFTDTVHERNAILRNVVPSVKSYAVARGIQFSVATMRWGVTKAHADNHEHAELCIKEILQCRKLSEGYFFISLLGQKYGFRPFPRVIEQQEFNAIMAALQAIAEQSGDADTADGLDAAGATESVEVLSSWFKLDTNLVPASMVLQPIRSHFADYGDDSKPDEARAASGKWWAVFEKMQVALRVGAMAAGLSAEAQVKYIQSVTEHEVRVALEEAGEDINSQYIWFKRNLTALQDSLEDSAASNFIDIVNGSADQDAVELLDDLKSKVIPASGLTNIHEYSLSAFVPGKGVDPEHPEHKEYINSLCAAVERELKASVDAASRNKQKVSLRADDVYVEAAEHAEFCRHRVESFFGREQLVSSVTSYLQQSAAGGLEPFVLYGRSGSGKTSVLAKAAMLAATAQKVDGRSLVLRFIGTTGGSTTIFQLLHYVTAQIHAIYKPTEKYARKQDLTELIADFQASLALATAAKPLVVFLDSLDQLSPEGGSRQLRWLPVPTLPPHVHMVLSTLPEPVYQCFPKLQNFYSAHFLEVPALDMAQDAPVITKAWLEANARQLTDAQTEKLMAASSACPTPLYLRLSLAIASTWKSSDDEADLAALPVDVPMSIAQMFDALADSYGHLFVYRALGYITVAHRGLSSSELEDIVSCNDEILNQIFEYWLPPERRIPPLLWARVRAKLGGYLVERGTGTQRVLSWHHRQFEEAAQRHFVDIESEPELRQQLASDVADYFLSKWAHNPKPFTSTEVQQSRFGLPEHGEALRFVAEQPLVLPKTGQEATEDADLEYTMGISQRRVNLRVLEELPGALAAADRLEELAEHCLCSFNFLYLKAKFLDKLSLLSDFDLFLNGLKRTANQPSASTVRAVKLVLASLRVAPTDIEQLPSQLLGRLTALSSIPLIASLLKQVWASDVHAMPCIVPLNQCLDAPSDSKLRVFGHPDKLRHCAVNASQTLVATACDDRKVYVWNIEDGQQLKALGPHDWMCRAVAFSSDGSRLVTTSWSGDIQLWDTESWLRISQFFMPDDDGRDSKYIEDVTFHPQSNTVIVVSGHANAIHEIDLEKQDEVSHVYQLGERSEATTRTGKFTADGSWVYGCSESGAIGIFDFQTKQSVAKSEWMGDLQGCEITADNQRLVAGGDSNAAMYTISDGKLEEQWSMRAKNAVRCIAVNDQYVVLGTIAPGMEVVDLFSGQTVQFFDHHTEWIHRCVMKNNIVYSVSEDRTCRMLDITSQPTDDSQDDLDKSKGIFPSEYAQSASTSRSGSTKQTPLPSDAPHVACRIPKSMLIQPLPDGTELRCGPGTPGHFIMKYDPASQKLEETKMALKGPPLSMEMYYYERRVRVHYIDGTADLWELSEDALLTTSQIHVKTNVGRYSDDRYSVTSSKAGDVGFVDSTKSIIMSHVQHFAEDGDNYSRLVVGCGISPDGMYGYSGGRDRLFKVWDPWRGILLSQMTLEGAVDTVDPGPNHTVQIEAQGGKRGFLVLKQSAYPDATSNSVPPEVAGGTTIDDFDFGDGWGRTSSSCCTLV
eukprot:m.360214 g.360214  ORF g.360214 m.360214 type:complete len:1606 (+) comp18923_c0_seq1:67-4884(+)